MYWGWFCMSDVDSYGGGSISNTTIGPSSHDMKPPSSRLGTLYNHYRKRFMTKIHVLRLVLFVQYQLKHCMLIWKTTLGPSGHGTKPPSSRLGTLYSRCRQWFMTNIHVFRLVMLVQRQFKRCISILNTTLGPSGHDSKAPSSKLGTLYSQYKQWFMTKIHVRRTVLFVRHQFKNCVLISNTTLGPSGHGKKPPTSRLGILYSHHRQWLMT